MVTALPDIQVVIIRMEKVPYIDQSGLYALEDAIMDLQAQDITVVFSNIHGQPRDLVEMVKVIPNLVPEEYCFSRL